MLFALGAVLTLAVAGSLHRPDILSHSVTKQVLLPEKTTTIVMRGGGTALKLSSHKTGSQPLVSIETEDKVGCGLETKVGANGETFEINVIKSDYRVRVWCDPDIIVSVPENLDMMLDLENLAADISGVYGDFGLKSGQSVINFDGIAKRFTMTGDRAIVRLNFQEYLPRDALTLDVGAIMSSVTFGESPLVSSGS